MNLDKFIAMADKTEFLATTLGMQLVSTRTLTKQYAPLK